MSFMVSLDELNTIFARYCGIGKIQKRVGRAGSWSQRKRDHSALSLWIIQIEPGIVDYKGQYVT